MAKPAARPERYHGAHNEHRTIKFAQIRVDEDAGLSHREKSAFEGDKLKLLKLSIVHEGQAVAFVVYESDEFIEVDGQKLRVYVLVSGHRRFESILKAIEENIDPERIHRMMDVAVVVMVRGEQQSETSFQQEVLVRSVVENEQRQSLSQMERLDVVARLEAAKVPRSRGASALSISESQYDRDARIVRSPFLYDAVKQGRINATDAAKLAEAAEKQGRMEEFREDFERWAADMEEQLERERAEQKKLGRELKGPANQIKKYLNSGLIKTWESALNDGKRFFEAKEDFHFGVVIDESKDRVDIPRLSKELKDMSSAELGAVIGELQGGARRLVPYMVSSQLREQTVALTEQQVESILAQTLEKVREEAERKAAEEAGREPADAPPPAEAAPEDLNQALDEALDAAEAQGQARAEADDGDSRATAVAGADDRDGGGGDGNGGGIGDRGRDRDGDDAGDGDVDKDQRQG